MPIQIPADAKTISDNRVTQIRVIKTLYDRLVDSDADDSITSKVKATMRTKGATFAESDLVVAALRFRPVRSTPNPRQLYELVQRKVLTIDQFLECVAVVKKPLEKYLGADAIDQISTKGPESPEPALVTEFKEGIQLDVDEVAMNLASAITRTVPTVPITKR